MLKIVVAAVAVLALIGSDAADAAGKHKRQKVRAHPPAVTVPMKSTVTRRPGPSWAGPNDCYTDEGYGRYLPCGGGMDM
jgi:hypothetical protein